MGIAITDLTPVERTAFVTQYARALDSRWPRPILGDKLADEVVAKIDYDFDGMGVPSSAVRQTALRAKMLDDRVRRFISRHPDAVVVALGAGLDTGMLRVEPPATVDWYNVDLPNVIALRDHLVPARDHAYSVAASVADDRWTDQIPSERPTILIADGLLAFFLLPVPPHSRAFPVRRIGVERLWACRSAQHPGHEDCVQRCRNPMGLPRF